MRGDGSKDVRKKEILTEMPEWGKRELAENKEDEKCNRGEEEEKLSAMEKKTLLFGFSKRSGRG